jgi:hypothetical protein
MISKRLYIVYYIKYRPMIFIYLFVIYLMTLPVAQYKAWGERMINGNLILRHMEADNRDLI